MLDAPDSRLASAVAAELAGRDLLAGVRRLLLGCSGGGDSVALVDLLARGLADTEIELFVGHVEHRVRPTEGTDDRRFVEELARATGLEFLGETLDAGPARDEAALRRQRLAALAELATRCSADAVALGHTADDVAETLLMNAARGAGPAGLASLRWRRRVGGLTLVRPLLGASRTDLREYLVSRGRPWREDSTNADLRITRNRVRQRVLPELEAAVPGAARSLARLSGIVAAEEAWWAGRVAELLDDLRSPEPHPGGRALRVAGLDRLHAVPRARVFRATLEEVRGDLQGIRQDHLNSLQELLEGNGSAHDLPGVRVRRDGPLLRFLPLENRRLAAVRSHSGARDES